MHGGVILEARESTDYISTYLTHSLCCRISERVCGIFGAALSGVELLRRSVTHTFPIHVQNSAFFDNPFIPAALMRVRYED